MRDLCNDTAHRRRVRTRNSLVEFRDAQRLNNVFLFFGKTDRAPIILDLDRDTALPLVSSFFFAIILVFPVCGVYRVFRVDDRPLLLDMLNGLNRLPTKPVPLL